MLGDDLEWAASNIPFLDFDDAADEGKGASLSLAWYFRWRVFKRHVRTIRAHGTAADAGVQCCSGSTAECTLLSAAPWCSGSASETDCHQRRTEARPCVWSEESSRCTKGFQYGAAEHPSCPSPRPHAAAAAAATATAAAAAAAAPLSWVVTEFEPDVPWAGAHNTIACSAGHHLMEGRWLRSTTYLDSYSRFWFSAEGAPRKYTFWAASAMHARYLVTGDAELLVSLYPSLSANYRAWVAEHLSLDHECFWQYADRDGQENSVGGDGCRPLLNAAMVGEATALASIATLAGDHGASLAFESEATRWQRSLLSLWSPSLGFFVTRAIGRPATAPRQPWAEKQQVSARALNGQRCPVAWPRGDLVTSRELQGLTSPWYFGAIPRRNASAYAGAWARLFDGVGGFAGPWGPRTAERSDSCYNYTTSHECNWNGPSWPFETSKAITAALNVLHDYPNLYPLPRRRTPLDPEGLWSLLMQFARAHTHSHALNASAWLLPGLGASWIGEALHPDTGSWLARERMYAAGSPSRNRGHRYLHSTFCDLVIGVLGVRPSPGRLVVHPLIPAARLGVRYFALDGLRIHSHDVTVAYDADGSRYGLGSGLFVLVDGHVVASGSLGERLVVSL